jgi:hypothetical protein
MRAKYLGILAHLIKMIWGYAIVVQFYKGEWLEIKIKFWINQNHNLCIDYILFIINMNS